MPFFQVYLSPKGENLHIWGIESKPLKNPRSFLRAHELQIADTCCMNDSPPSSQRRRFQFPSPVGRSSRSLRPVPPHCACAAARPRGAAGLLGAPDMLSSLGLVGTIAEGDEGPEERESGDSEDEEVGPGRLTLGWMT